MMINKARCAAVVLALLASTAGALSAGERQGARISLPEPKFDFGKVSAGTTQEHIFEIRNAGDEVLQIQKVQPT